MAKIKIRKYLFYVLVLIGTLSFIVCGGGAYWYFEVYRAPQNLRSAINNNDIESVQKILDRNPSLINHKYVFHNTPLVYAVDSNDADIVRLLIERGADMYHEKGTIGNPCNYAAFHSLGAVVKVFIEAGYKLNHQPVDGDGTCLHRSCDGGDLETVKYLIKKGADINSVNKYQRNRTPLLCAVSASGCYPNRRARIEIVELLLKEGADATVTTKYTGTALEYVQDYLKTSTNKPLDHPVDMQTNYPYRDVDLVLMEVEKILIEHLKKVKENKTP